MDKVLLRTDELLNANDPDKIERIMVRIITDDGEIIMTFRTFIPAIIEAVKTNKRWLAMKREGKYIAYENGNIWEYETTLEDAVKYTAELLG